MSRYGIAEWFGCPFKMLAPVQRQAFARAALKQIAAPPCPFQAENPPCSKKGGVCSIQSGENDPVITCPRRFEQGNLLPLWLAKIVGFQDVYLAHEVPFMRSPSTGRAAGRIDLVVAGNNKASDWFGLEIQAVYFSGGGMEADFRPSLESEERDPPSSTAVRRADWRSSSAKRLMPQLQVKGPTLRRWGTRLAVAVDYPFFEAIGGPSDNPSCDLDDGDIVWLVPWLDEDCRLRCGHWEILSLEASSDKLLAADTIKRTEFEKSLRDKLEILETGDG